MQHYESERNLEAEITANIENLENFYGLSSVDSLKRLVDIILDPKKSEQLFKQRNVTVSSIFQRNSQQMQLDPKHIDIFASKYTFQKLVEKFPRPRGETNRMLSAILQRKFSKEVITSHQTRKNLWMLLSGARFNMIQHRGLYDQLLIYQKYPDYFTRAITQDINRTVKRSQTSDAELKSLENVLIAFSRRNPYVGYCQGLNFIAHFILTMQFSEEQAFWMLSSLIQTVIPMDYYTNMIGVVCDQQVFLAILENVHPDIAEKFNEVGLDPSVLSIEWFVCLFTSSLPLYLVKIVWDRLLVEGPQAIIKTGIIIVGRFKQQILNTFLDADEIIMLLEKRTKQLQMTEIEFNSKFEKVYISREGLVIARTLYRQYHLKEKLSDKLTTKKFKPEEIPCNPNWPICAVALELNRRTREQIDVWTFRQHRPPKLDHQYLLRQQKKSQKIHPIFEKEVKNITPAKVNRNTLEGDKLFCIREANQTDNESVSMIKFSSIESKAPQSSNRVSSLNAGDDEGRDLIIGRILHICDRKAEEPRPKPIPIPKDRRSIIMVQSDEENEDLKRENIIKMIEGQDTQERFRRSQTVLFFSKFVNQNLQLSSIMVPSMKRQ